jgi:hypothetical protein
MLVPLPFCQSRLSIIILVSPIIILVSPIIILVSLHNHSRLSNNHSQSTTKMPSWTDIAGFCFAALGVVLSSLYLWAVIFPKGMISERLHPPSIDPEEARLLRSILVAVEYIAQHGQNVPRGQPNPFEDIELVTTARHSPRRR